MPVEVTIGGSAPNTEQAAALRAAFGIPEPIELAGALTELADADLLIVKDATDGLWKQATAAAVATYAGATPAATAPATMTDGDWDILNATTISVISLVSDGGSALTDIEINVNGGSPISLGGAIVDDYTISALTADDVVRIRLVNAIGPGEWSDPTTYEVAPSGALAVVQAPAPTEYSSVTAMRQDVTAVATNDALAILVLSPTSAGAPTSITDSAGNTWPTSPDASYAGAEGQTFRAYHLADIDNAPTWVQANFGTDVNGWIAAAELSGGGASLVINANGGAPQGTTQNWQFPFTSTVDNTFFMGGAVLTNGTTLDADVSPLTAALMQGGYSFYARGLFPTAGSYTPPVDLIDGRNGDKAWFVYRTGG